ncbi:MAG: NAD-glutamate dehydrogenase domain-containing protein, partial [Candidatus Binatia bacterium]
MPGLHKAIAQLMESRQDRPVQRPDPATPDQLLERVAERLPAEERPLAEAFARALFADADLPLDGSTDATAAVAVAAGGYAFLRDRGAAPLALRVFTPQMARDGWESSLTVVEAVLDDRPFIVDTVRLAIEAAGGEIRLLWHPLLGVERAADGHLAQLGPPDAPAPRESFCHVQVAQVGSSDTLQRQVADRLRTLITITDDYAAMRERVAALAHTLRERTLPPPWDTDAIEVAAFLAWLGEQHFVYLGYDRCVASGPGPGAALGLLRGGETAALPPRAVDRSTPTASLLSVAETPTLSPVHRAVPMDDLEITEVDADGRIAAIHRLVGIFTARAYSDPPSAIPIVRQRLDAILTRARAVEDSHDARELTTLFDSFPREELLASTVDGIEAALHAILAADAHPGVELHCRPDAQRRGLFALVLLPRARFSTELHGRVAAAVRHHLRCPVRQEHLALDDHPIARLHFYCAVAPDDQTREPLAALQAELAGLLRTWDDELRDLLGRTRARGDADRLLARYGRAFPPAYKVATAVEQAARDVHHLDALLSSGRAQVELAAVGAGPRAAYVLKLYLAGEALSLSDFVPVVENLGWRVLGQNIVELALADTLPVNIHAFSVTPASQAALDLDRIAPLVVAALQAVRAGEVADDPLNALVTTAALPHHAVDLLRAYAGHARQIGIGTQATLIAALTDHPDSARQLFELFATKFDPAASALPAAARAAGPVAAAQQRCLAGLDAVPSLIHDSVLRALAAAVVATVRTNFYSAAAGDAVALKLDGSALLHLPPPRPAIETWVHSVAVQGLHLRAGRIARGGIRASDRRDDFRAEILGLMRTQVIKNAVIVPVGAKGGFVALGPRRGAPPTAAQIEAAYRAFIGALLSITDGLERGVPIPPAGQLIYDAPDPYLVVAADKGTGALSDVANAIAAERHFWLGDAFASGGRHGYDHKRLAITARGAWECARLHFRELGRDLERETVSVVGIGDMSGDVFGNGLLRSRHLRLLAAFDHRHVFVDPDPDPERAYRERERLFAQPRSGWNDYADGALSPGGGVYRRDEKAIALSPQARALLGVDAEAPSGEAVVRAILRLPVDLWWNGGIGTYVKASDETHLAVADPGNDSVRIDAGELRATVVAEGGNLGLTQCARIEYALAGGRVNTDAIDNSAGVDLSDHEVNLKIALQPVVASGTLAAAARDELLATLADPVCESVLQHNRSQARALGLEQLRSRTHLAAFRDLMMILEAEAGLDRAAAHLPTRETLRARRAVYVGLTRPELAVLMAHTKLDLRGRLVQSALVDAPGLDEELRAYFPAVVVERFADALRRHPLRREIIAVQLANQLVDEMGMTFLVHAVRDTGRDVIDIVRAWISVRRLANGHEVAALLDAARAHLPAEV